ncbi:hypothetical protein ACFWNE_07730 [Streptomyces goshikiensis]|uniref:hypothetical protein n=1 Tax=Streptomyces goshikiensis TaxID=1942 RepID=UPI0036686F9E
MGYIAHDAVIVTTSDCRPGGLPDIESFRARLPESLRHLVIGPIAAPLNGHVNYAFLPDGSKKGWLAADEASEFRRQFAALFSEQYEDGSTHDDTVSIRFGGDHRHEFDHPAARYTH